MEVRQMPERELGSKQQRAETSEAGQNRLLTEHDIYLFKEGSHFTLYEKLGSHPAPLDGEPGVRFGVWAPNAASISVIGDFNEWDSRAHPLQVRGDDSGI